MRLKTISGKVSLVVTIVMVLFIAAIFWAISFNVDKAVSENVASEVKARAEVLNNDIEELKQKALNATEWFENSSRIANAVENQDRDQAIELGKLALKSFGLDYLVITDTAGNVFIRAHEPEKYGDSISSQVNIQKALQGEKSVGIEEGSVVKYSVRAGTPLRDSNGNIIGAVSLGYVLSNSEYVDRLKNTFNCDITIFSGDERIATTIRDKSGNFITGTKLDNKEILNTTLKDGKPYYGKVQIAGKKYYGAYLPIFDVTGTSTGMLFLGEQYTIASQLKQKLVASLGSLLSLLGILMAFCMILIIRFLITKKIKVMSSMMKEIAEGRGDLTQRMTISSKDEIGEMSHYFNSFMESIQKMVKKIIQEADNVNHSISLSQVNVENLTRNLEEASSTIQHLSAGIEETAAATEEITTTSSEIETVVESVAEKSQEGASSAGTITKKVLTLKDNSAAHRAATEKNRSQIMSSIDEAVEKTKEVEKLKSLSDVILQIASQTNLLALNAAIESARAGEAGKGFSVVSEEIRKLAESSKDTVKEIQVTLDGIFEAVHNLTDASKMALKYIEVNVADTYKELAQLGDSYEEDAGYISNWAVDLSAISQQLLASIKTVSETIDAISIASSEGSAGTSSAAGEIIKIRDEANELKSETAQIKESADQLKELVIKFKV